MKMPSLTSSTTSFVISRAGEGRGGSACLYALLFSTPSLPMLSPGPCCLHFTGGLLSRLTPSPKAFISLHTCSLLCPTLYLKPFTLQRPSSKSPPAGSLPTSVCSKSSHPIGTTCCVSSRPRCICSQLGFLGQLQVAVEWIFQ